MSSQTRDPEPFTRVLLNTLLAGRDTASSVLITNLLQALSRSQLTLSKVYSGLTSLHLRPLPTSNTPSLNPSASTPSHPTPLNSRTANDRQIPSPRGHKIGINIYSTHRLPSIYRLDANAFPPECWENPELRLGWGVRAV